ncbi:MAG: FAD-binding and (Fe-S)-binding domain-containing protein [Actinomycetaceae bacterium]|nr:FAD-binding and (Fe-S)-binding domain-containing protein [Actinomycetaceae bacterium]MDY5854151.1 FAD-binding and (Fe-S)-binding domain-containing protein [Arcanobacterium sp.]
MSTADKMSEWVAELSAQISGDVETSARTRAQYSTDASNYRVPPAVVVFPRDSDDVRIILAWAREHGIGLTARGGGTSVAGNAIGTGVIVEYSRYMNKILSIDAIARTARVQPGVVMSDLQRAAARYGLRFGPDPSTQNRATFGGMIGNNACGPHAVAYGKTAENVLELHCIDGCGREFVAGRDSAATCEPLAQMEALVGENLAQIRTELGQFGRQVSGYSLEWMLPEYRQDLAKMLVGTEGTLVAITEARVRLVPIAAAPMLVVLGYPSMPEAADAVPALLEFHPLAIEGMDAALVDMVRRAKGDVPELPEGNGWLMVEVGAQEGEDPAAVPARAQSLAAAAGTDAVMIEPAGARATKLWQIRADGAGLGGRTPQETQAWPGWEDSAVPPAALGAYLRDLQALMDRHGLHGLMYGHFGDGCVHVRIDFPLDSASGVPVFREFMEQAADIVASYGGSLSGEHGDGRARSELLPRMYSPQMMQLFRAVKTIFDPQNLMNPGVLVTPDTPDAQMAQSVVQTRALDADLRRPHAAELPYAGGFHFSRDGGSFTHALHHCTGVGKCRADNASAGGWMCPSYQATKDEKDVTRGRMRILQEVAQQGYHAGGAGAPLVRGFADRAVLSALDLCLGCKACSADCPAGVDLARFKSEALYRGYQGRIRPRTHYLLGNLPALARLATAVPAMSAIANAALGVTPLRKLAFKLAGLDTRRLMPGFARRRFSRTPQGTAEPDIAPLSVLGRVKTAPRDSRYVMLWADSFSETLDTRGAQAMVELLQRHGYTVLIPPEEACCGLTWITTGQLGIAKRKLQDLLRVLAPFAASGIPIVGVEPSCTAVLRDDVLDLLPDDARSQLVSSMTFTLAELLTSAEYGPEELLLPQLSGVRVIAQPHCHHYSVMGWKADAALLRQTGADVQILNGCCGLAGNFGMEQGHYDVSVQVAERELLPALRAPGANAAIYLADGFSCRTQAAQLAGKNGVHLAELLLRGKDAHAQ